jgi:hypothetical protein
MENDIQKLLIDILEKQNDSLEKVKQIAVSNIEASIEVNNQILKAVNSVKDIESSKDITKKLFNILIHER